MYQTKYNLQSQKIFSQNPTPPISQDTIHLLYFRVSPQDLLPLEKKHPAGRKKHAGERAREEVSLINKTKQTLQKKGNKTQHERKELFTNTNNNLYHHRYPLHKYLLLHVSHIRAEATLFHKIRHTCPRHMGHWRDRTLTHSHDRSKCAECQD